MRIQDVHVEVRGKNLDGSGDFLGRQGTILNRDLNLQAKTRWCGVGEWELTLPGGHPMVPYLMQEGSGLVVNGPVDQILHPPVWSAWTPLSWDTDMAPIRRIDRAGVPSAQGYITDTEISVSPGQTIRAVVDWDGTDPADSALFGLGAMKDGVWDPPGSGATNWGGTDSSFRWIGPTYSTSRVRRVKHFVVPPGVTQVKFSHYKNAGTGTFTYSLAVYVVPTTDPNIRVTYISTPPALAAPSNADSTLEQKKLLSEAWQETVYGPLFSGPTLVPNRKRDVKNPDGTLTFKGVTDEILLDDALAFPSPTIADPEAQTRANDDQAGPAETLLRYYVNANLVTAPAARKGGFRDFVTVPGADTTLGESVAKSPRFQNLLELCQEIATTSLVGFRMVQVDDEIQFQVVETRDLRKEIRLDVDSGTLNSEETQFQPWALTRALVAGQGEGTDRKILTVTTPEATASELSSGRIIERWVNQSNTNDDAELETKGLEELADAAGGTAAKAIPADTITMQYGRQWREGDWITVIIDGEERDSVVTEAVFSFTKDLVGIGVALGDVSSFKAESAERKQAKSLDARVAYMERAGNRPALSATGAETLDWNQATENGNYWGNGAANAPYAGMVMGQVLRDGDGRIVQEALDPSNLLYGRKRRVMSGGVWGAWKPVGDAILPAAWVGNGTSSHAPAAGTGWSSIPGALRLELPAYDRDLLVDVDFGAIGSASTGYWMIGASVFEQASGPWSIPIENADPRMAGTLSTPIYGLYAPYSQTAQIVQISGSKPVIIPAGVASVFQMATRKSVSAAAVNLNYSSMQVKPVRWI